MKRKTGQDQKASQDGGSPPAGRIPADRVCAGSSGRHTGGFPCGRWTTLGDVEEEKREKEKEDKEKKEKEEREIPCLLGPAVPGGNSLLGNTFSFCSLTSIAGACPREEKAENGGQRGDNSVSQGCQSKQDPHHPPL